MPEIDTPHGGLHYDVFDAMPPWQERGGTVLFHHGVGANGAIWNDWLPALLVRYRLVCFDMRGCGRSAPPSRDHRWSMDGMLSDLLAVADAAGAERFHLVGESIGGTIALCAGLTHPERIESITAVSCTHAGGGIPGVREWERVIADQGMEAWSAQMMRRRFHDDALSRDRHAWYEAQQAGHSPQVVLGLAHMLLATDLTRDLPELHLPVLLLAPDGSPFVGPAVTAAMHGLLPDSEMHVFANSRHGLPYSHGRQCAAVLADFLARRAT